MSKEDGIVDIHGQDYKTIALRVNEFRAEHPDWTIETQLIHHDDERVVMKALIMDGENLISTGYAEEVRGKGINVTSALENCETSAVGRALAFYKYAGLTIRSADEMRDAVDQQTVIAAQKRGVEIGLAQARNVGLIGDIQDALDDGNYHAAYELWHGVDNDDKSLLWVAPSKGGCFTTKQIAQMKSSEWTEARQYFHSQEKNDALDK